MQPHFVSQIDVSSSPLSSQAVQQSINGEFCFLLRELVAGQERQNELLEELVDQVNRTHRQKIAELSAWKHANPQLSRFCKLAADKLGKVQTEFLASITEEIEMNAEDFSEGDYVLSEFLDKFGPRFVHLNGLLQVLSQLGNAPDPPNDNISKKRRNPAHRSATF